MRNVIKDDIFESIKKVLIVFLLCFLALITYIAYFTALKAPNIANKPENQRLIAKRNEVLRGTIYDRNKEALTKSERASITTQNREYTAGPMFVHALGYSDITYGITGLEKEYDEELMSSSRVTLNYETIINYFKNKEFSKIFEKDKEKIGNGVVTTLDYNIQKAAYDALGKERGSIVVLNPKTGEVLAMVSKPSYDPNNLKEIWNDIATDETNTPMVNRAVAGLYPPGSTFKVLTTASALENIPGITEKTFNDTGKIVFNSKESLNNLNNVAWGNLKLDAAFRHSSNVVFGTLALDLGNDKLKETAEKFYFNKSIPSDGFIINKGNFPNLQSNEKGHIAQTGIGQGAILSTPMQMALVAGTVANDGEMMKPHLVKEIVNPEGNKIRDIKEESLGKIISKDNSDIIKSYMRSVITGGTGGPGAFDGTNAAGKTGTADYKDKNGNDGAPHSWFIGFAPYEDPQVAIAVIVEGGGAGGGKAAKTAGTVFKAALLK
ncbi:penicillin-binding protein 2 [Clostridium sp. MSJ-4]|uniref:Penicillin-binding protein 2 n=1 Tax=Clostridium simiarum TaxID=2841506 RepID=A0ABS6F273_9CLOT|nr:penicillin-binding protein 2 [Clostridium simiarum]MBU5592588.1 penicillin-binding protein 2 [Clostridium simiarum]